MMQWNKNILEIKNILESLTASDLAMQIIPPDMAFDLWVENTLDIKEKQKRIFLIGNGASASMASHVAADLGKNVGVDTEVFTDLALITAIGNDISYEEVFTEPLGRKMKQCDMLIAISSSGNSSNIVKAIEKARSLEGFIVTVSAMDQDNTIRQIGDLNFYVPANTYGMAESCHAVILHHWIDWMLDKMNK